MQWTGHWILIGLSLWTGPSTHRKCLFVPSSSASCRTGCVGVCMFSTVIIRTGVCVCACVCVRECARASLLRLPPMAAGSKNRRSPGRKFLTTRGWDHCAPNKGLPPHTGSGGAAERERALPLPPPLLLPPALPVSSSMIRVLSQMWAERRSPALPLFALRPSRKCSRLCLRNRGPISRQSRPKASGKRESPDFISSHLWSEHPSRIDGAACLQVYMGERPRGGAKRGNRRASVPTLMTLSWDGFPST